MPSPATTSSSRYFSISDDGDGFQLALFDSGTQVAGALFPDDGSGQSFELARSIGLFYGKPLEEIELQ